MVVRRGSDSCVQNMFEQNPYWNLEKWHESCYKYNVNLPWSDHVKRSELAADLARIITTVGDLTQITVVVYHPTFVVLKKSSYY